MPGQPAGGPAHRQVGVDHFFPPDFAEVFRAHGVGANGVVRAGGTPVLVVTGDDAATRVAVFDVRASTRLGAHRHDALSAFERVCAAVEGMTGDEALDLLRAGFQTLLWQFGTDARGRGRSVPNGPAKVGIVRGGLPSLGKRR